MRVCYGQLSRKFPPVFLLQVRFPFLFFLSRGSDDVPVFLPVVAEVEPVGLGFEYGDSRFMWSAFAPQFSYSRCPPSSETFFSPFLSFLTRVTGFIAPQRHVVFLFALA